MRVKIFSITYSNEGAVQELEDRINLWLSENPNINVRDRTQSSFGKSTGVVVAIWYNGRVNS